jgi:hypothetical protein
MGEGRRSPLSLNALLAAVEAAPPVAAVDVPAGALAEAIGAREVSFLIADFSTPRHRQPPIVAIDDDGLRRRPRVPAN